MKKLENDPFRHLLPKTIICDIDGVLIKHNGDITTQCTGGKLLPGVKQTLISWDRKGYRIILITGRRESKRNDTMKQLTELGVFYDELIMGVGGGDRIIINDTKPASDRITCKAICLKRNVGLKEVNI